MLHQDKRNGHWFFQYEHAGKLYKKSGFLRERDALKAERESRVEAHRESGKPIEVRPSLSLDAYFEIWMSEHVKHQCRPRTADLYRQVYDQHISPRIGRVSLRDLDRPQVKRVFAELDGLKLARNTVGNILIPLRACLNAARDDGLIDVNPADRLKRSSRARLVQDGATVSSYTAQEADLILKACLSHGEAPYSLLVRTLVQSGLRLSEVSALRPGDVEKDHLWVKRSVQYCAGRIDIYAPKSGKTRRVDIPVDLAARLRAIRGEWCFPHLKDRELPAQPKHIRAAWTEMLAKLDLRRLRVHDLRHTYAGLMLAAGAPLVYVCAQLGHSSIQVTADVYCHLIPGTNRKWVDNLFQGDERAI